MATNVLIFPPRASFLLNMSKAFWADWNLMISLLPKKRFFSTVTTVPPGQSRENKADRFGRCPAAGAGNPGDGETRNRNPTSA